MGIFIYVVDKLGNCHYAGRDIEVVRNTVDQTWKEAVGHWRFAFISPVPCNTHWLRQDTGIFGDVSDPFVVVQLGKQETARVLNVARANSQA